MGVPNKLVTGGNLPCRIQCPDHSKLCIFGFKMIDPGSITAEFLGAVSIL